MRLVLLILIALFGRTNVLAADREWTVSDLTSTLATAALESGFPEAQPAMSDTLARYLGGLEAGGLGDLSLEQLVGRVRTVDWKARLRWRQGDYRARFRLADDPAALEDAISRILLVINTPGGLDDHLVEQWGEERAAPVLEPMLRYQEAFLRLSLAESLEKVRRFEIKYGPGSARLNVLETFLAYGSQWIPGFGPDENGWPGAWEWIAGYSTTFVSVVEDEATLISGAQVGLRRYLWAERWPGAWNFVRPRSIGAGFAIAGERNGPLVWPGQGSPRYGGFIIWGPIQLAYLGGDDPTVALTHTIQLFPGLF